MSVYTVVVSGGRGRARLLAATALALLFAGVCAPPALTAGTGGIEVTPVPAIVDGKQVTAFHTELPARGRTTVRFALRNITAQARSARVYAAEARPDGQGGFQVLGAGSSPYVRLVDRTVRLAPRETRSETFEVLAPDRDRPAGMVHAAVVVEVQQGSVVQRAATLVYLGAGEPTRQSRRLAWVALALLLVVSGGLVGLRRQLRVG